MRGELAEVVGGRVGEDHAPAGQAREADVRQGGERGVVVAHLLERAECSEETGAVVRAERCDVEGPAA